MTEALQNLLQQFINGLQTGSVYALIAIGYTMVYGVLKFINFAHGDVYMVGAYLGFFAIGGFLLHLNPVAQDVAALLLCMAGCAALGAFIERLAYRPLRNGITKTDAWPWALFWGLYAGLFGGPFLEAHTALNSLGSFVVAAIIGFAVFLPILWALFSYLGKRLQPSRSRLNALITAIGLSLLLENQWQASFTATPRQYADQGFKAVNLHLLGVELNVNSGRVIMLVIALMLTAILVYIVRFTRTGRAIRAVSLDPEAAALQGIPTDRIIGITFLIGASLAGAAGFLNHNLGQIYFKPDVGIQLGLKAFVAAVLGGIGSIEGAVLGALLMGLAESFVGGSSLSSFKNAIAFVILIAVLLFRPSGLLGRNVPEKV